MAYPRLFGGSQKSSSNGVFSQLEPVSRPGSLMNITQTVQHVSDPYYEDFEEGYSDGDEDAQTIYKVSREILDGNMKGIAMDINDGDAVEAIGKLCAEFAEAMSDKVKYRYLLTNRGGNAQKLVNILQMLLDYPLLDQGLKSGLLKVLMRVSTRASVFPTCLTLYDIQFDREPISDGFLSQIWQGTFKKHTVALKVIKIYREKHVNDLLKSLWREGILWAHLSHPNVAPFYGIYNLHKMEEQVCLVSPWMNQGNVMDFLSRNPRADRVKLVFEVAKGMEYLHENSVIHGDLKGANVLITDAERAVLCDFGLSTVILDVDVMAYTSIETIPQSNGTLRYQAPELFAPEDETESKLTKECDIYSFSCLCYEIFTGKLPFYEVLFEPAVLFQVHSGNRPSRPAANDPSWNYWGLTEDTWALMGKCWSGIPSFRPSSTEVVHAFGMNVNESHSINNDGHIISSSAAFRRPLYDLKNLSTAGFNQPDPANTWTQDSKLSSHPFIYGSGIPMWRARSILTIKSGSGSSDPSIYSHGTGGSSLRDAGLHLKAPSILSTALSTLTDDTFYAGRSQNEPYKVLILGATKTGKSTIVKQLKIAYGGGYTDSERDSLLDTVFQTFTEAVQTVMDYMAEMGIECSTDPGKRNYKDILYIKSVEGHIEFVRRLDVHRVTTVSVHNHYLPYSGYLGDYQRYRTINYIQSVINLLADPAVTALLKSDWGKYRLDSSKQYFLNHAVVFQSVDYLPSDEEIIYASRTTTGIWETDLKMRSLHIRMYDVGGTRSERKKWIHRFESITSVIFCIALDDYYKVLPEYGDRNRMEESIVLFEAVHSTRWFTGKPTILLLNKFDVFKEVIRRVPLNDSDYQGGTDVLKAVSFILGKYKAAAASVKKPVYHHLLQATDLRNIRQVFRAVRDEILLAALEDHVNTLRLVD